MHNGAKTNKLTDVFPDAVSYWNYKRNDKNGLFLKDVSAHSGKKAWWICEKAHSYQRTISSQVLRNGRCPYCINRRT